MERKIRTAAYVRVSVKTAQMQHSLQAQMDYYERMINKKPDLEFAGIYIDYGISGTGIKKRKGFCQMMEDCKSGKIDRILVKSVSRFARNTVDLLTIVRQLKEWNISVYFEEQKVDSMTEEGELMLTLIASIAQAESESVSENVKWAIRSKFAQGIGNTKRRTFGYKWIDDEMVIIPEEAEAVKQIFEDFLMGYSRAESAKHLAEHGIRTVKGNIPSARFVSGILRNSIYTGNTILQKTFVLDPISKKKKINTGELPQYLVKNTHEAIIDQEIFDKVQEMLAQKKNENQFPYNRTLKKYPFSQKIICGCCGRHYTRLLWNTRKDGGRSAAWVCTGKMAEKHRRCNAKNISEEKLMKASAEALGMPEFDEKVFAEKVESIIIQSGKPIFLST